MYSQSCENSELNNLIKKLIFKSRLQKALNSLKSSKMFLDLKNKALDGKRVVDNFMLYSNIKLI